MDESTMEMTMEHDVCALDDITDGGKKVAKLGSTRVLLMRAGDEVFAVRNTCPHMKVPLNIGTFDGTHIQCRLHGSRYNVRTGQRDKKAWMISSMGEDVLATYSVTLRDGRIFVEV